MEPESTGRAYDTIAPQWEKVLLTSCYGLSYLEKAIANCARRGKALDIGCGTGGRMINALLAAGMNVTGIDISAGMLAIAKPRHPTVTFIQANMATWNSSETYDLILAWDSTFHLPIASQEPVLRKLCRHLEPQGILLFTSGGIHAEISGEMYGQRFEYSSLSEIEFFEILTSEGCKLLTFERDQYPLNHTVTIAVSDGIRAD
jgi:predicted TPR repeat methyltransferase